MTFSRKIFLATSLLLGTLSLSSCKDDAPKVDEISVFDLRLASFGMNSTKHKVLRSVAFSIKNNVTGPSEVFNPKPLAFGQEVGKVKLIVTPIEPSTKVEIALGESADFKEYDAKKEYDLTSVHRLKLRLVSKQKAEERAHIYNVEIRQFRYNPMSVEWTTKSTGQMPQLGAYGNRIFELGGMRHLFTVTDQGLTHYTSTSIESGWTEQGDAMPVGVPEHLIEVEQGLDRFYALGAKGGIYELQGTVWVKLASDPTAKSLLAVLPARTVKEADRLALLLEGTDEELKAKTDPNSRHVYGYYQAGKVVRSEYIAPSDFPMSGRSVVRDFSQTTGSRIHLLGASGKRTAWYTTNAEDWQELYSTDGEEVRYGTLVAAEGQLYSLETSAKGLKVWVSQDRGITWSDAKEVGVKGLDPATFAAAPIVAFADSKTHKIYLLQGGTAAGGQTKLYEGTPLKDAIFRN